MKETLECEILKSYIFSLESGPENNIQFISGNSTLFHGLNELATLYCNRVISLLQLATTPNFKGLIFKPEHSL